MSQKNAYVTGGMGGIGTAICQRLHREGFKVIAGCGPTRDYGKWLAEQKEKGYTFYASVGNVGDWIKNIDWSSIVGGGPSSSDVVNETISNAYNDPSRDLDVINPNYSYD